MAYSPLLAGQKLTAARIQAISGIFVSYTPTWTSSSGAAPSLGNGTLSGEYALVGDECTVRISLEGGNTTTWGGGQHRFALPFTAASLSTATMAYVGTAYATDAGTAYYAGAARILTGGTVVMAVSGTTSTGATASEWNATRPFTWATGDALSLQITYKPA